jgi:hypothetical protein
MYAYFMSEQICGHDGAWTREQNICYAHAIDKALT